MTWVVHAATLYNTRELARATRLALLKDIMADTFTEERRSAEICTMYRSQNFHLELFCC